MLTTMSNNLSIRPLSLELQEKAVNQLNEKPHKIEEYLEKIREWLNKQPHLLVNIENQNLLAFLRGSKWSVQFATEKIDNFYTVRSLIPDFFENRDPTSEDIQTIFQSGAITPLLDQGSPAEPIVIVFQFTEETLKLPLKVSVKAIFMTLDILMKEEDRAVISGFKIISDCGTIGPSHILMFSPMIVRNFVICLQKVYPMRLKEFVGLNAPGAFDTIYNTLAKPFLSEKMRKRFHFISENVWTEKDGSIISIENTGGQQSLKELSDQWYHKVNSYRDWFIENDKLIFDESLRLGKLSTELGSEGSFRKLSID